MHGFEIDRLTTAVKILGLSDAGRLDFPMVRRRFNHLVRLVHPDKNGGVDKGLDVILAAYRLLDHYFNVVLTGKNCHVCRLSGLCEGSTCDDSRDNTLSARGLNTQCLVEDLDSKDPKCKLEEINLSLNPSFGSDRKCSLGDVELIRSCELHRFEDANSGRFYELSGRDLAFCGDTPYVQCRCGQAVLVPREAMALGICTFHCDVCSCSYCIADLNRIFSSNFV